MKQLEQQFGSQWACSCRTPLDLTRFEVLSESETALLAHYTCPVCGREQIVAVAAGEGVTSNVQTDLTAAEASKLLSAEPVSADDVLDIREELKKFSPPSFSKSVKEFKSGGTTVRAIPSSKKSLDS